MIYKTSFQKPADCENSEYKKLIFEGLDTHCDIYLNGKKIHTSHNMYRRFEIDVGLEPQNYLEVRFNSSANYDI